jgi:hypothetical protein
MTKQQLHRKSSKVFPLCLPHWVSHVNGGFDSPVGELKYKTKKHLAGKTPLGFARYYSGMKISINIRVFGFQTPHMTKGFSRQLSFFPCQGNRRSG